VKLALVPRYRTVRSQSDAKRRTKIRHAADKIRPVDNQNIERRADAGRDPL
jgi:hypothetical protein